MTLDHEVCAACGVVVARARNDRWVHADELPEKTGSHDVESVTTRREYLFGVSYRDAEARVPQDTHLMLLERQAIALENIAEMLQRLVQRLDT